MLPNAATITVCDTSPSRFMEPTQRTVLSPFVFPPCPRGPGRPKEKRQGRPGQTVAKKRKAVVQSGDATQPLQKKRGRPPGSRNKNTVVNPLIE